MKVDVLGLGMLGCMNRAFDLLEETKGVRVGLRRPPGRRSRDVRDDPKADTLGVFQIESRAQMSMLPRMKPRASTTSRSRSRSCAPARSRATWSTPICAGATAAGERADYPTPRASRRAGKDAGRAAVPGTGDEGRDRRRGLHPGRGRPAAPRDGDVQVYRRRVAVLGQAGRGHGRRAAIRREFAERTSARSRASAPTAFPRATPRASPRSPTPRRG